MKRKMQKLKILCNFAPELFDGMIGDLAKEIAEEIDPKEINLEILPHKKTLWVEILILIMIVQELPF